MAKDRNQAFIAEQLPPCNQMIDQAELHHVFDSIPGDGRALYIDVFATGCYLHRNGSEEAGLKLIREVLHRVNRISSKDYSDLFQETMASLSGNEKKYALAVPLRAEFRSLFKD
jgi:hypothetical protein